MRCKYCDEEATSRCAWAVKTPVLVPIHDIRHGDVILSDKLNRDYELERYRVADITATGDTMTLSLRCEEQGRRTGKELFITGRCEFIPARVWRDGGGTCQTPVCDLHQRELDENKCVCQDHWDAWQEAFHAA